MNNNKVKPLLSILVVGYRMAKQLANTLHTLSPRYQRNVKPSDYEVIVVENESDDNLANEVIDNLSENFRYFRRPENANTPVPAINFGFELCRGKFLGLMIDGARMMTPRIMEYALMAHRINENSIVAVPGYHIGKQEQHLNDKNYRFEQDEQLLATINWQNNGYKLFTISTFSNANRRGYLQPMFECNCLFSSLHNFEKIGFADERFNLPGGGSINLHMYRSLGLIPNTQLFVLPGEGSFHQYHGGVTTSNHLELQRCLVQYSQQLNEFWPDGGFQALRREPILLGSVTRWANSKLYDSSKLAEKRFTRLDSIEQSYWPDDSHQ